MRSLLRFRLRTLFIVISILGVIVYPVLSEWQIMQREQAALRALLPTSVDYSPADSPIARWIGEQHPRAGRRVTRIVLERNWSVNSPAPKDLTRLRRLQHLRTLEINNPVEREPVESGQVLHPGVRTLIIRQQGRSDDMDWLSTFPGVRSLALRSSQLSPAAVENIAQSQVRSLEIGIAELPPGGLAPLTRLGSLRSLSLSGIAAHEAPMLWASLPHLSELTVDGDWRGRDGQLLAPMQPTSLKTLRIGNRRLHADDAERIAAQPEIQMLHLHGVRLTTDALRPLRRLPRLHTLRFSAHYLDADAWAELGKFTTLQRLEVTQSVGARQMAELGSLTQLQVLQLDGKLSDDVVDVLLRLPVQRVIVYRRKLTKKGRQRLEATRSGDRLTIRDDL